MLLKIFLQFFDPSGLRPDYINHWLEWIFDARYNPKRSDNETDQPDAREKIIELLGNIPTYSIYIEGKLKEYNEGKKTPLDESKYLPLLKEAHPRIELLDVLAKRMRRTTEDPTLSNQALVNRYIRANAAVSAIFRGEADAVKFLQRFGLQPIQPARGA